MEIGNTDNEYQEWLKEIEAVKRPIPYKYEKFHNYQIKGGWLISELIARPLFEIRNKIFRPSDIIITALPKSGKAWLQQVVYLIETLDYEGASEKKFEERYLSLERPSIMPTENGQTPTDARFYCTHLPFSLLPKDIIERKCKIIHVARNPKDRVVSYYHFMQLLEFVSYKGTFKNIFHEFVNDNLCYLPYAKYILEYWKRRNDENVMYITYEALHKDLIGNIKNISEFLGKSLTEEQIQQIAEHCGFSQMAINPATNYSHWDKMGLTQQNGIDNKMKYMRKGKVGDWKNYFDEELEQEFQDWYQKNFKDEDIEFDYDI